MHEWIRYTTCFSSYESLTVEVLCRHSGELQGCYRGVRLQSNRRPAPSSTRSQCRLGNGYENLRKIQYVLPVLTRYLTAKEITVAKISLTKAQTSRVRQESGESFNDAQAKNLPAPFSTPPLKKQRSPFLRQPLTSIKPLSSLQRTPLTTPITYRRRLLCTAGDRPRCSRPTRDDLSPPPRSPRGTDCGGARGAPAAQYTKKSESLRAACRLAGREGV